MPFDEGREYDEYVDGRPRADGVRTFLAARGIQRLGYCTGCNGDLQR